MGGGRRKRKKEDVNVAGRQANWYGVEEPSRDLEGTCSGDLFGERLGDHGAPACFVWKEKSDHCPTDSRSNEAEANANWERGGPLICLGAQRRAFQESAQHDRACRIIIKPHVH